MQAPSPSGRPAFEVYGKLELVEINPTAFIVITGNALTVSEDLARRFLVIGLDAKMEDPEERPFAAGFLDMIRTKRAELLRDLLTIWRWGRQNRAMLDHGQPFGSFEIWAEWVRDPLLTLGCADPVKRIAEAKAKDPRRRQIAEILNTWFDRHDDLPVKAVELHDDVRMLVDPQGRGRQFLVSVLDRMNGTRVGGLTLTVQRGAGKWSVATYAVTRTGASDSTDFSAVDI